jgi:hypothetical protein
MLMRAKMHVVNGIGTRAYGLHLSQKFVEENSFLFNLEKVAAESGKLLMFVMPIRWSTLTSMKRWRKSWCHNLSRATTKLESLPFNSKMFPKMPLIQVDSKIRFIQFQEFYGGS